MKTGKVFLLALAGLIAAKILLMVLGAGNPQNPLDFLRPVDDSYITFRYAQNLGTGKGLVYNTGERVEGGTTFAMILLLAPFAAMGIARLDVIAILLSLFAQAGIVALAWRFMMKVRPRAPGAPEYFAAAFMTLSITNLVWAHAGMETTLQAFAWFAVLMAHIRESDENRIPVASALLTVFAGLLHPDAILIAAVIGVSWLMPFQKARIARGFLYGAIVLALFGTYWIWRWKYFGWFLPNTFYAKVSGSGDSLLRAGLIYLRVAIFSTLIPVAVAFFLAARSGYLNRLPKWGRILAGVIPAMLFLTLPNLLTVLLFAFIGFLAIRRPGDLKSLPRWGWICLSLTGLYSVFIVRVGGDFYPFHRFFQPLLPMTTLLFWKLWTDARDAKPAPEETAAPISIGKTAAKIALIIAAMNLWSYFYTLQGLIHRDLQRVVMHFGAAGMALRSALPPDATIATLPIGAVGYFSGLRIHDMMGLVEKNIAHMGLDMTRGVVGHQKYNHAYTLSTRPEAIIVLPSLYPRGEDGFRQWNLENALEPVQYRIYNEQRLKLDYRLAHLPVGKMELYGFLRNDLVGKPGYESWLALDENAVAQAYGTPQLAAQHPLHGRSFGIWSFK